MSAFNLDISVEPLLDQAVVGAVDVDGFLSRFAASLGGAGDFLDFFIVLVVRASHV